MKRAVSYEWTLPELMARNGMHNTTDLASHLKERDVSLSPSQVYRLVTQRPERISLHILAALCDIFHCTPADLVITHAEDRHIKKAINANVTDLNSQLRPRRARVHIDDD